MVTLAPTDGVAARQATESRSGAWRGVCDKVGRVETRAADSRAADRIEPSPQEIDELRESALRMGEKMRAILAKEKQAEAE